MDLKQIKCKTCGEPLDLSKAAGGVISCGVCGGCFTLPKSQASQKVLDYLFQAEGDLDTGRFDDAYTKFAKAAELDKTEPEAYWGMALAEYKIQYLKDEVNNRLQPVCHEINDNKFTGSGNYKKACEYATAEQKKAYEDKAEEIDYIKAEFGKLKKRGVKYDCFICVKVSENCEDSEQSIKSESEARTADSEFAGRVYRLLKKRAFEPFYSETVLKNVTGADYEAHILYALATADTMLVICFDEAYLRTKWVKNEYSRFLKLVNDEEKESDSITLVYRGKPIEKLPNRNGKIQGIDANEDDWSDLILRFVESHTPEAKRMREEAAAAKAVEDKAIRKRLEMLEEMFKSQQSARQSEEDLQTRVDERIKDAQEKVRQLEEERKREEAKRKETEEQTRRINEERARVERERKEAEERERIARDFEIENGVLKKYKGKDTEVVIPFGVTEIGEHAFYRSDEDSVMLEPNCEITSITIPDSVTKIGRWAFGCKELKNIKIPNSVTNIEVLAFSGCVGLESLTVENGNVRYKSANNCILSADGLTLLFGCKNSKIPEGVTRISAHAFSDCSGLTGITIPNSVKIIDYCAFDGCEGLTKIVIPNGVTSIEEKAFRYCSGLTSVTIPDSVIYIGNYAFSECRGLKNITLPDNITSIDNGTFYCCTGLTDIKIPNSVTSIGDAAFNCCGLTSITLPNSINSIGECAFRYCTSLTSITIPKGVKSIERSTFEDCRGLTDVIIPDSVTSIGEDAFRNCCRLTSIVIPNSVTCIGEAAFITCIRLNNITIPDSVTCIGPYAFAGCRSLTNITIPSGVTSIGMRVFDFGEFWPDEIFSESELEGFTDLEYEEIKLEITFGGNKEQWFSIKTIIPDDWDDSWVCDSWDTEAVDYILHCADGDLTREDVRQEAERREKEREELLALGFEIEDGVLKKYNGEDMEVVIPNGVTSIGEDVFSGKGVIKSIKLPDSMKTIGSRTFAYCRNLESVIMPNGVTSIGYEAFSGCFKLTSINIPNSVLNVGSEAFARCDGLVNITIPDSLTEIGNGAFDGCIGLKKIIIPTSVTYINGIAFEECKDLTIYCRAEKQPKGWHKNWNKKSDKLFGGRHKVVWGYKGE